MLRERNIGGVWALLGEQVIIRTALRWRVAILEMLEEDDIPRMLGQYDRWQ